MAFQHYKQKMTFYNVGSTIILIIATRNTTYYLTK